MARPKKPTNRIERAAEAHGSKWRNRYIVNGRLVLESFESESDANAAARRFEKRAEIEAGETVTALMDAWINSRADRGVPDVYQSRVVRGWHGGLMGELAAKLTETDMVRCMERYRAGKAASTMRNHIQTVKTFYKWAVETKRLKSSPMTSLIKEGRKPNKRAVQIETIRELYVFRDSVWDAAYRGEVRALGILIGLYLGARPGEVVRMQGKHVDIESRVIVPGSKTVGSYRSVRVPMPELVKLLEDRAREVGPDGYLVPRSDDALLQGVKAYARDAGITNADRLTFRSLRGMVATLGTSSADVALEAVAGLLGHASYSMTREHYATPSSQLQRGAHERHKLLERGRKGAKSGDPVVGKPASFPTSDEKTSDVMGLQ